MNNLDALELWDMVGESLNHRVFWKRAERHLPSVLLSEQITHDGIGSPGMPRFTFSYMDDVVTPYRRSH